MLWCPNLLSIDLVSTASPIIFLFAKNDMLKVVYKCAILVLVGLFSRDCLAQSAFPKTIGISLPLSGEGASVGESVRNGIMLAYDSLPEEERAKVKLVFEDDGAKPSGAVLSFNKLTSINGADIVINPSAPTANTIAPLAERKRVPFIALASDAAVSKGRYYVFTLWVTSQQKAKAALKEALRRGYKKIALFSAEQDGCLAFKSAFELESQGKIGISLNETFELSNKDFRTYIAKLRTTKDLDGVMLISIPGQLGIFVKTLRQSGISVPLFGNEVLADRNELTTAGGALNGAWYVSPPSFSENMLSQYRAKYPQGSLFGASSAYDALLLAKEAVINGATPDEIARYLKEVKDFNGSMGSYSATGDNWFSIPAVVKVID